MNYSPCVVHVHKVHTPCNVNQKLANLLDNREQYKRNCQDLNRLLRLRYLAANSRQLLVGSRQFGVTIKHETCKIL